MATDLTICCPAGHKLQRYDLLLREFTARCHHHRSRHDSQSCGRCIYVLTDWHSDDNGRLSLCVEVTEPEIREMRHMGMLARLRFLGLLAEVRHAN